MSKIATALTHYRENGGPGASLPTEDMQAIEEYLILKLEATGVPFSEAYDIVRAMYWGSWSQGWEGGYEGARAHYAPRFSLTTEGYGSQAFRDEIEKSEA